MRAHLADLITCVVAGGVCAVLLATAPWSAVIAAIAAAVFALALRALGVALLKSLEPQTRHEKRMLHRITQDIQHRMAQRRMTLQREPTAGGGA